MANDPHDTPPAQVAGRVVLTVTHSRVHIPAAVADRVEPVLRVPVTEFGCGGPRGHRRRHSAEVFYQHMPDGGLRAAPGLAERAAEHLLRLGVDARLDDRRRYSQRQQPDIRALGLCDLDLLPLLSAAAVRPRGFDVVVGRQKLAARVAALCRLFSAAPTMIVETNAERAEDLYRRLSPLLDGQVFRGSEDFWRAPVRRVVAPLTKLDVTNPDNFGLLIAADVRAVCTRGHWPSLNRLWSLKAYGFQPADEILSDREQLRSEAVFGRTFVAVPATHPRVVVHVVVPPRTRPPAGGVGPLERKREAIWKNPARNPTATLVGQINEAFAEAREHYAEELKMYSAAIDDLDAARVEAETAAKHDQAKRLYVQKNMLLQRLDAYRKQDWITFFSDRTVLPSYAFPIYNVPLVTSDRELKLERDLRLALSEYVPGAAVVAHGRLWRSVGVRKPFQKQLTEKYYARCPVCSHVMRHLNKDEVFPGDVCPVCQHDGAEPRRRTHRYRVPEFGFTTDLTSPGEELAFDKPLRIPTSRVLFVPQQEADDPVRACVGAGALRVEVRSTEKADFFVFNAGDEPDGRGFKLCKLCYRRVETEFVTTGRGKDKVRLEVVKKHRSPFGKECVGNFYDAVHLGHEFISSAVRLTFTGTNHPFTDQPFWLSLLYAVLGGMADALGVESGDINGVIRPVPGAGDVAIEVVVFDDVPGGAGHALRLEGQDELVRALDAARARVANCECGETAACYRCLRSYRNQFCHDTLARGPVAEYLTRLLDGLTAAPGEDRPYLPPDRAAAVRSAIRDAVWLDVVADRLDPTGSPEVGPWYLHLLEAASRPAARVRLALKSPVGSDTADLAHLIALSQAGAELYQVKDAAPPPPYGLLSLGSGGKPRPRSVGFSWGEGRTVAFDAETHTKPLRYNPSADRLATAASESDAWLDRNAEPVAPPVLFQGAPGAVFHAVQKGAKVDFGQLFKTVAGRAVTRARLQDPYLVTAHQMSCLQRFLQGVFSRDATGEVPFDVATHIPWDAKHLTPAEQRTQLEARCGMFPALKLKFIPHSHHHNRLHMRFAHFALDGGEVLYLLERGLDMTDPKNNLAVNDTYVLEFQTVPAGLSAVLKL